MMPWGVILAGGIILMIVFGTRHSFGLFLGPIEQELSPGMASLSFAIAIQNLIWGFAQPLAGGMADRYGSGKVLAGGIFLYGIGLIWVSQALAMGDIYIGFILFCGLGLAATSFSVTLAAVSKRTLASHRSVALGLTSSGGSMGQFIMAPICFWLISSAGWREAFLILSTAAVVLGLGVLGLMKGQKPGETSPDPLSVPDPDLPQNRAKIRRSMILLCLGFFVCGFQVVFIMIHLPPFLADRGLPPSVAATALSLIGLFNIFGTLSAGWLGGRYPKAWLLTGLYSLRSVAIGCLILITPLSPQWVYGLCILIGLLWLATVPLTSGLTADLCSHKNLGTIFGIVFLSHQIGAFFGAWSGGWWREYSGEYEMVWVFTAGLGLLSALFHAAIPRLPKAGALTEKSLT